MIDLYGNGEETEVVSADSPIFNFERETEIDLLFRWGIEEGKQYYS